jgi:hypothetical protein
MGEVRFFEGAGCSQHLIGRLNSEFDHEWDLSLISSPIPNGQVKSCTLIQVQAGAKVRVFDSSFGTPQENCAEIRILTYVEDRCITSFSEAIADGEVEVRVHNSQGTLGPITRIEMQSG